jgi:hypothetical protein
MIAGRSVRKRESGHGKGETALRQPRADARIGDISPESAPRPKAGGLVSIRRRGSDWAPARRGELEPANHSFENIFFTPISQVKPSGSPMYGS